MEPESAEAVLAVVPRTIRIAFETPQSPVNNYLWLINFLTPNGDYRWQFDNDVITAVPSGSHAHYVIVLGQETEECKDVPRKRKIYFQLEPDVPLPTPQDGYLYVVSLDVQCRVVVPWDMTPYKESIARDYPIKEHSLAIICKRSEKTPLQKKRMELLRKLAQDPTLDIHIYSMDMTAEDIPGDALKGIHLLKNKAPILTKYRYCLCLEKYSINNYLTEHFADAMLGYSFPIYHGATNVKDLYNPDSFHQLKNYPDNLDATVEEIRQRVNQPITVQEIAAMRDSRHRILNYYSLWGILRQRIPKIYDATKNKLFA